MKTFVKRETRTVMNAVMHSLRALLFGLAVMSMSGCEVLPSSGGHEADDNPGTETVVSGDAKLLIHVDGVSRVNIYLDGEYIGSLNPGDSRTWNIPPGQHESVGTAAEDSYTPTSWTFDVAPGQTEERYVGFAPNPNAH